jgi:hypothetical protein
VAALVTRLGLDIPGILLYSRYEKGFSSSPKFSGRLLEPTPRPTQHSSGDTSSPSTPFPKVKRRIYEAGHSRPCTATTSRIRGALTPLSHMPSWRAQMGSESIRPMRQGPIRLQHNKADCVVTSNDRPFNKDRAYAGQRSLGLQQQCASPVRANLHLKSHRAPGS